MRQLKKRGLLKSELQPAGSRETQPLWTGSQTATQKHIIDCDTKVFGIKQVPHTKAPNLICMFREGKHHTPATLLLI